jgi:hypothetical protein
MMLESRLNILIKERPVSIFSIKKFIIDIDFVKEFKFIQLLGIILIF